MRGGVRKKGYSIFILSNFVSLPLLGWHFGESIFLIIGLCLAIAIDIFFPTWKYELTWQDIELALNNIFKYGSNPCELRFLVGDRKIFVYRDERGNKKSPIRMSIRIPLKDWPDLFEDKNFHQLVDLFGGKGLYHGNRGPDSYGIFPREGIKGCKDILNFLFENSVGGLRSDIYARSVVNAKKNIWIDHSQEGKNGTGPQKSRVR
jgi:hypothetical protein